MTPALVGFLKLKNRNRNSKLAIFMIIFQENFVKGLRKSTDYLLHDTIIIQCFFVVLF